MATETTTPPWVATVKDFESYWFMPLGGEYEASMSSLLSRTWPRIQAALQSSGQANCDLATGMIAFLNEQHCIITMVMLNIPGVRLETDQRELYAADFNRLLVAIASREFVVCDGDTANVVPASGRVERYN